MMVQPRVPMVLVVIDIMMAVHPDLMGLVGLGIVTVQLRAQMVLAVLGTAMAQQVALMGLEVFVIAMVQIVDQMALVAFGVTKSPNKNIQRTRQRRAPLMLGVIRQIKIVGKI